MNTNEMILSGPTPFISVFGEVAIAITARLYIFGAYYGQFAEACLHGYYPQRMMSTLLMDPPELSLHQQLRLLVDSNPKHTVKLPFSLGELG